MSADAWSAAADWVMAIAALGAAVAAWRGLQTWRRQETWKEDRQLARETLRAILRYEGMIAAARSRTIRVNLEDDGSKEDAMEAYQLRMYNEIIDRRADLVAALDEARILWGEFIPSDAVSLMIAHEQRLRSAAEEKKLILYDRSLTLNHETRSERAVRLILLGNILFRPTEGRDEFFDELKRVLETIADPVRQKLDTRS